MESLAFTDIHCHILPAVDDGARNLDESLAMARIAATDGIGTIVATPHQLGASTLDGRTIRGHVEDFRARLRDNEIPLNVLAGGDVRIEANLVDKIQRGDVLTLADRGKHVLLELPHELWLPMDRLLSDLTRADMVGILSHPERNLALIADPRPLFSVVDQGCLLQITADSLLGTFGSRSQRLVEQLVTDGLVHFVATDAHGVKARRPKLSGAFQRIVELTDHDTAIELCKRNPARVVAGENVSQGRTAMRGRGWTNLFGLGKLKRCG